MASSPNDTEAVGQELKGSGYTSAATAHASTLREPAVRNMRRALLLQYTAGAAAYYGVSVAGYWAYGAAASEYLPDQLGGPRWAVALINAAAFLQSVVSQHMFTVPLHEAMDTRLQRLDEGMFSRYNLARRFAARGLLFGFNAFVPKYKHF
ncbi:hypothetical protein ACP70R_038847 [Stipagrostis hirtigluma subsp. patula]